MMKKILSLVLALALCLGLAAPAVAVEKEAALMEANDAEVEAAIEKRSQRALAEEYCFQSKYNAVMENAAGDYALLVEEEGEEPVLLPVGCIQVDLLDSDAVNEVLERTNLSEETKNAVEKMASKAEPCSECDTCNLISVFSPDLLPKSRGISTSYYTYKGMQMKVEQITKADHAGFASIGGGTQASTIWKGITNAILSAAGIVSTKVSIFGTGLTLLDAVRSASNCNNVYPAGGNDVQAKVRYTGTTRYTYANVQDWMLGCVSHSVLVEEIEFSYDVYENMERALKGDFICNVNRTVQSESYSNHWEVGYYNYNFAKVDGEIELKLGSKTFWLYTT